MTICIMFTQGLLVEFINKKDDGFWLCWCWVRCFHVFMWGVCRVWLGHEACVAWGKAPNKN